MCEPACGGTPLRVCLVGRAVTQPDWDGWTDPCPRPATQHLRRTTAAAVECYPICDHHMDQLQQADQLAPEPPPPTQVPAPLIAAIDQVYLEEFVLAPIPPDWKPTGIRNTPGIELFLPENMRAPGEPPEQDGAPGGDRR